MDANHREYYNWHGPRCFLQELPGHVQFVWEPMEKRAHGHVIFFFFFWGGGGLELVTNLK